MRTLISLLFFIFSRAALFFILYCLLWLMFLVLLYFPPGDVYQVIFNLIAAVATLDVVSAPI